MSQTNSRIDKLLLKAIEYLDGQYEEIGKAGSEKDKKRAAEPTVFNVKGKVEKEYVGAIASFGATIIQSGLIPAVFLYSQTDGSGKEKRPLMDAILHILTENEKKEDKPKSLLAYVRRELEKQSPDRLTQNIIDAAVALKLAIRTFEIAANASKPQSEPS